MQHTTHTQIVFADSKEEAKEKYLQLGIKPDHDPNAIMDIVKCDEEEDFDIESPFNLVGEVSISESYMDTIRTDYHHAYCIYYIENH